MTDFFLFIVTAVTALAVENAVFARALGLGRETMFMNSARSGILLGGVLTWMCVLSSLFVALVNFLIAGSAYIVMIRPMAYLAGIVAVYLLTALTIHKGLAAYRERLMQTLPISTFNTALFGAFYISASQTFNFFQTTGYALGTGAGYTAALLITYFARKRLAISPIPRSFRGLPVLLIYLGLISLAVYGLIGQRLPT